MLLPAIQTFRGKNIEVNDIIITETKEYNIYGNKENNKNNANI
jgi:hypothetical protein